MPANPNAAAFSGVSGTSIHIPCAAQPRTTAAGDADTSAPAPDSGAVAVGDRSQTVVRSPAETRLRANAEPMMPVPSAATRHSRHGYP